MGVSVLSISGQMRLCAGVGSENVQRHSVCHSHHWIWNSFTALMHELLARMSV